MRYGTQVFFQKRVPGAYDSDTGNYEEDKIQETLKYASVMDTQTKMLAKKLGNIGKKAGKYWKILNSDTKEARSEVASAVDAVGSSLSKLNGSFGSEKSISNFKSVVDGAASGVSKFAGFCEKNSDSIAKLITVLPKVLIGYKAFKVVKTLAPGVSSFSKAILSLLGKGIGGLAAKLFGVAAGETAAGNSAKVSNKKILTMAKSTMMLGVGVLTIAAGFGILAASSIALANSGGAAIGVMVGMTGALVALTIGGMAAMKAFSQTPKRAQAGATALLALGTAVVLVAAGLAIMAASSIALANAGTPAIACMAGMVVAVVALAAVAAAVGPALTASSVGLIAFGAAVVLVGAGALLAAAAIKVISTTLPTLSEYGTSAAVSIAALGASMVAFGAGALVAGAGCVVLGAGLVVVGAGAVVAAAGVISTWSWCHPIRSWPCYICRIGYWFSRNSSSTWSWCYSVSRRIYGTFSFSINTDSSINSILGWSCSNSHLGSSWSRWAYYIWWSDGCCKWRDCYISRNTKTCEL